MLRVLASPAVALVRSALAPLLSLAAAPGLPSLLTSISPFCPLFSPSLHLPWQVSHQVDASSQAALRDGGAGGLRLGVPRQHAPRATGCSLIEAHCLCRWWLSAALPMALVFSLSVVCLLAALLVSGWADYMRTHAIVRGASFSAHVPVPLCSRAALESLSLLVRGLPCLPSAAATGEHP